MERLKYKTYILFSIVPMRFMYFVIIGARKWFDIFFMKFNYSFFYEHSFAIA